MFELNNIQTLNPLEICRTNIIPSRDFIKIKALFHKQ